MNEETGKNQEEIENIVEEVIQEINDSEQDSQAEINDEMHVEAASSEEFHLAEIAKYKEEVIRLMAEMDNLRKRNARELESLRKFALDKFAKSLIPVADSLDKALEVIGNDDCEVTAEQMVEGTELTQKVFLKVLTDNGIEVVNPVKQKFNPEFHEAMAQVPSPDLEANTVVDVFQKGYLLNGRLIRPAMVVVSK
jgi:molecular chaperone GrpE